MVKPIGFIQTVFDHKFGTPRQGALAPSSHATLHLEAEWRDKGAVDRLESFSHIWLISYFHQNASTRKPSKIHPPRLLGESVGVLASRSPHRPNNLGLTLAKLERVEGDRLHLTGVDLVSGTPILDIKPYLAEADRPPDFSSGWTDALPPTQVKCIFDIAAKTQVEALSRSGKIRDGEKFMALVAEVLALDPRPLSYRERVNERFAIVLAGMDVHARYHEEVFTVISVRPFAPS